MREDLNADEAGAFGAAFRGANLSSAFRVRQIGFEDITPYPVGVRLVNIKEMNDENMSDKFTKRGSLFNKNNKVHKRRGVTLKHGKDLHVTLFYEKYITLPVDSSLSHFCFFFFLFFFFSYFFC